jgi:hypothetical protein
MSPLSVTDYCPSCHVPVGLPITPRTKLDLRCRCHWAFDECLERILDVSAKPCFARLPYQLYTYRALAVVSLEFRVLTASIPLSVAHTLEQIRVVSGLD